MESINEDTKRIDTSIGSNNESHEEVVKPKAGKLLKINDLLKMSPDQLKVLLPIDFTYSGKQDAIYRIASDHFNDGGTLIAEGVLEIINDRYGFLRYFELNLSSMINDVYVDLFAFKRFSLKEGDCILCTSIKNSRSKHFQANNIIMINEERVDKRSEIIYYKDLPVIFPNEQIKLEAGFNSDINRIIDLWVPVGFGQRGIIAAAPKTGKTLILENLAKAFTQIPNVRVLVLMIAERPEESIHFIRKVPGALVISSSFDESPSRHVSLTSLVIAYALRQIELKRKIILLVDSLTRYVRAVNLLENSAGKILTGGLDSQALIKIKEILGAARNVEGGGSLTIIATMLIATGSKMDDIIFDESKGTSNWDLVLSSELASKSIFPSIDLPSSSTRKAELMMSESEFTALSYLRQIIVSTNKKEDMLLKLLTQVRSTNNNSDIVSMFSTTNKKGRR